MSSQDFKGCPQCGARGTSLGAIVAKETSSGRFTGSASGIGVGTGGIGVGVGSVSGTSTNTSYRAAQFSAPETRAKDPATRAFFSGIVMLLGAAIAYRVVPPMLTMSGQNSIGTSVIPEGFADIAAIALALVMVAMAIWTFFRALSMGDNSAEMKVYNRDAAVDQASSGIHQRLRYCDSDHLVFDPVSGQSCVGEEHYIHQLAYSIAHTEMTS